MRQESGIFHGWVVVGAAFVALFVAFGIAYSFGAFFAPLQEEFGATRAEISLVFSIAGFAYFMVGIASGQLADRLGPRRSAILGMAALGLGMIVASRAESLIAIYAAYGIAAGIGVGCVYVPTIGAVQRWFVRRRGLASGIAVAGIGCGTLVLPWVAAWLIGHGGWRLAYLGFGIGALILGLAAACFLDAAPERRGLAPDGDAPAPAPPAGARAPPAAGFSVGEAVRTPLFWSLYLGVFLAAIGNFIPFVHLPAYTRDHGLSEALGVLVLGLIGAGSTVGRFVLGGLADRVGRRRSLAAAYGGMGILLLFWLAAVEAWSLIGFALVFGVFYGGFVALIPALTADYFGSRAVSGIIGALYSSLGLGALAGPTLAGLAFDLGGSYALPILGSGLAALAAAALVWAAPEPARFRAAHAK